MPTTQRLHRLVTTHRHGRAEDIFSNHPATALSAAIFNATDGLVQPTHDEKLDGFVMRASAGLFHCHLKKNAGTNDREIPNSKLRRAARLRDFRCEKITDKSSGLVKSDDERYVLEYQERCGNNVSATGSRPDLLNEECLVGCAGSHYLPLTHVRLPNEQALLAWPLRPPPPPTPKPTPEEVSRLPLVGKRWNLPSGKPVAFVGTRHLLGGGLNNMLMQFSQLLEEACNMAAGAPFLLPRLDPDPKQRQRYKPGIAMWELLNTTHLVHRLRQCDPKCGRVIETLPFIARKHKKRAWAKLNWRIHWIEPLAINTYWNYSFSLLRCVYKSAEPSDRVRTIVDALEATANSKANGKGWSALHLPIERDWWWESNFCAPRENESYHRRCYTPKQAAAVTQSHRMQSGAAATFLMYAHDKVSTRGPAVCANDFGSSSAGVGGGGGGRAYKLALPSSLAYTVRNAAEQFFAARAPIAFYGNLRSTFSKGVALLRAMRGGLPSFAYDCSWNRTFIARDGTNRSLLTVLKAHPGYAHLRPLPQRNCDLSADDESIGARVERWKQRGKPPL